MGRESPAPPIDTVRLMHVFWLDFSTLIVDDDQMQARGFEQSRKLLNPGTVGVVLGVGDDVVSHPGAQRKLTLTQVAHSPRRPNVSICRKVAHEPSLVRWRALGVTVGASWDLQIGPVDSGSSRSLECFALTPHNDRAELTPHSNRAELTPHSNRAELTPYSNRAKHRWERPCR